MTDSAAPAESSSRREAERLEAFSDGVMAVIITLMALELHTPVGHSFHALWMQRSHFLIYVLSFTIIGIYWNNHHHLFRATERISGGVMWANLVLLFWLSLIPVMTDWIGNQYRFRLPASVYGIVALGAAVAYGILVQTIIRSNGRSSAVATAVGSDVKGNVSMGLYVCGVGLAWVSPWIAYALYVTVAVIWFVPDRRFTRSNVSA